MRRPVESAPASVESAPASVESAPASVESAPASVEPSVTIEDAIEVLLESVDKVMFTLSFSLAIDAGDAAILALRVAVSMINKSGQQQR